ncbi:MAG: NADPH-dependent FMN reductase, partial [Draconibacterium sp.]|nr:NADPH-dependent FMN reductase [Draconibacterium sp.]
ENGIHELAYKFKEQIKSSDGIIISFAEHNGAYSVAFKNIFDWVSRFGGDVWEGRPMLLLATAPGSHGGKTVLDIALKRFSRRNKNTIVTFSLPSFKANFSDKDGIADDQLRSEFAQQLEKYSHSL